MQARFLEKRNPWSRLLHFPPRLLLSRNPIEKVKKNSEKEGNKTVMQPQDPERAARFSPKRDALFSSLHL